MEPPISGLLLRWYDDHARVLPWRGIQDPYATWVSETMLQQTRVDTVLSYYKRFMAAFPDVSALAAAPLDDVLKQWEGLGYYRRAQNLHRGAKQVVRDFGGVIPATVPELMTISGIGSYTAGAIASIAFGQQVPAVDGNVIRVVSRVRGIRENVGVPSVRRQLEAEAAALVPAERAGDFNQAVMDLGATVCVPGTPSCDSCPLREVCDAYAADDADMLPVLPRKAPPKVLPWDVCLVLSHGRLLMRQRTEALLQGLWVCPMLEGHHDAAAIPAMLRKKTGLSCGDAAFAGEAKHVFTHQVWQMKLYLMETQEEALSGWRFFTREELAALAIPTAMRKARTVAEERLGKP